MRHPSRHPAVPGPRGYPPLGVFPLLRRDPLLYLTEAARRYGEVVSLPLGWRQAYLLAHPAGIQHGPQDRPHRYRKGASVARITPLFGEGLTTSEGALWRRQRRLIQLPFQWQRLLPRTGRIAEAAAAMLARWEPCAARAQTVPLTKARSTHTVFAPDAGVGVKAAGVVMPAEPMVMLGAAGR
jgi:cytochrome P450